MTGKEPDREKKKKIKRRKKKDLKKEEKDQKRPLSIACWLSYSSVYLLCTPTFPFRSSSLPPFCFPAQQPFKVGLANAWMAQSPREGRTRTWLSPSLTPKPSPVQAVLDLQQWIYSVTHLTTLARKVIKRRQNSAVSLNNGNFGPRCHASRTICVYSEVNEEVDWRGGDRSHRKFGLHCRRKFEDWLHTSQAFNI